MFWPHKQDSKSAPANDSKNGIRLVLTAEKLLAPRHRQILLREIQGLVSIPVRHYEALFETAIRNYASFVQELPASEIHHHSAPGGMLDHGLEVTKGALAIRRGHMLPPGAEPEALAKQADRWTYAVFTGALLHDIGKPAVDQIIRTFAPSKKPLGQWTPWNGPMAVNHYYHMDFVRPRRYGLHPRVGGLLAHHIIPPIGLTWLTEDQELFESWLCLITGDMESAGVLGEIIHEADGRSVARNLGAGDAGQFPSARTTPLHKKLLTGLRYLITEGHLPLNRNGAAGWLDQDDLWLVSKRTVDALRDHLHQEGHTDIPSRNDRIFDVLQEHAILEPNAEQAIWRAKVADGAGEWAHELTLLRIARNQIWPNLEAAPEPFSGTVKISTGGESSQVTKEAEIIKHCDAPATIADLPSFAVTHSESTNEEMISTPSTPEGDNSQAQEIDAGIPFVPTEQPDPKKTFHREQKDAGEQFLNWLQTGLASGEIITNDVRARVHVVPEGVLIVSPAIFKDFAHHSDHDWNHIQKRFQKLGLHEKTPQGTNIHNYRTTGGRKSATINGLLIQDSTILFPDQLPPPNPHLGKK